MLKEIKNNEAHRDELADARAQIKTLGGELKEITRHAASAELTGHLQGLGYE